ncbi:hypothetical protein ACOSQ3_007369 [Xanthoceras sorbifolium]
MDGFDISNLCASLSLSEKDGPIATLDSNLRRIRSHKLSSCLVGKVLRNRVINKEAFRSILPKIWKTSQEVDISKPLQRCVRLFLDDSGKASTMILRYERLPDFCSHCGRLGHVLCECVEADIPSLVNPHLSEYGGWLHASSPVRNRRLSPIPVN